MSKPEYQNNIDFSRSDAAFGTGQRGTGIPPETPATVQQSAQPEDAGIVLDLGEEDWAACAELAQAPLILIRLGEALRRLGLAGERRAAMLLFLALISRLLEHPVSIAMKGPSSAGKSNLVECVLKFFPKSAYKALSAMSEKVLAYSPDPISHKILVFYEAAGMGGEFANYFIRSLLSEGRLAYEVVVKCDAGYEVKRIEREGPTGLITTTTAIRLHPENETRYLSVSVDDSPKQTGAVMLAIAEDGRAGLDLEPWLALQRWLEGGEHRVVIPYAVTLAEMIPAVAVRLRRDFGTVLNLIRAQALLHRATRRRDSEGRIIAELRDYVVIHMLAARLLAEGVESTVPQTVRETVAAVVRLTPGYGDEASLTQVAKELGLDKSSASRRIRGALQRGHLRNLEPHRRSPLRLVLGDPLPADIEVLPDPKALEARCCSVALQSADRGGGPEQAKGGDR